MWKFNSVILVLVVSADLLIQEDTKMKHGLCEFRALNPDSGNSSCRGDGCRPDVPHQGLTGSFSFAYRALVKDLVLVVGSTQPQLRIACHCCVKDAYDAQSCKLFQNLANGYHSSSHEYLFHEEWALLAVTLWGNVSPWHIIRIF